MPRQEHVEPTHPHWQKGFLEMSTHLGGLPALAIMVPDSTLREQLSNLRSLLMLSILMMESLDEEHIPHYGNLRAWAGPNRPEPGRA